MMKKMYRKLSWLLLLAMLVGVFATGVVATDTVKTGTAVSVKWGTEAPVTEVKLELYQSETKAVKDALVFTKDKEWKLDVADLAVKDAAGKDIEYTAKILTETVKDYTAEVKIVDNGVQVTLTAKTTAAPVAPSATPAPSEEPSATPAPSAEPSETPAPSAEPSEEPSATPAPSAEPSATPAPSAEPSEEPSETPAPSEEPSETPAPSAEPSEEPSETPVPSTEPTVTPTPSEKPDTKPETVSMTATVVWQDGDNQDAIRPSELKVQLYNGENASGDPVTMKAGTDGKWAYAFTDLAKDGQWTVKVVSAPEGYTVTTSVDEGGNVTIICVHTPATTSYTVTVNWNDGNDQLKQRPDSVQVQLYKVVTTDDGNKRVNVGSPVTIKADNSGKWTYTFTDLAKYAAGTAVTYKYQLVETPSKYTVTYNFANGTVKLTNSYKNNTTMDYKVTAKWVDNNNKYNKRPSSISVTLYADGVKSKTVTLKPDSDGNWEYTFKDIAEYKNGSKVSYEVKISAVSNYVSKVKYTTTNGVTTATITNTYSDIPLTGDSSNLYLWIALVIAAGVALGSVTGFWFRKNRA